MPRNPTNRWTGDLRPAAAFSIPPRISVGGRADGNTASDSVPVCRCRATAYLPTVVFGRWVEGLECFYACMGEEGLGTVGSGFDILGVAEMGLNHGAVLGQ